ncbi:MAG: acyl-CoA dehydrogenase family protein [Actinomycetota bacterium]|jgi:glutaryl-CoA dehydrogenase|nr:acyl-CoA dehydrogenase family protein [Rubrobacteraceae bacterium]MBA3702463.1 acyl-CoA dehydrogenase family protein [Rubrobacteraceae bacterium]MDQ3184363.1 acyl-CoA dehydrogenase family protein [Actinomycetota bacterium]MDQ3497958.1 acyl-CoA dehydrogenase family protein [Actinomycetota bacterium]
MSITSERTQQEKRPVDLINAGSLLSDEEKRVRDRVREFVDREVIPTAADYWDRAQFPFGLLPGLGELGLVGGTLPGEYGCAGWNNVAYGLAIAELARGSGSLATFLHVQSGLAMTAIHELGSEEQKRRWLPPMAKCEKIGCFGLTEPGAGSDPGSLSTTAVEKDGGYVLSGEKKWIGNASFSDVAVIWARTDDGKISGFLVETDNPGFQADVLPRKASQRAAWQTHIMLEDCHIPEDARLPKARGLGSTLSILTHSRYGVGWDGLGQAADCYEMALAYAGEREQFGRPIASFQLVQQKLVEMVNEISLSQLLSIHVGRLKDAGGLDPATVSLFKMNNVAKARRIAATAREVLGGNGILLDYRVMEHMADIEGVYTYEGTNDVNTLIVGQAITGHRAFSSEPPQRAEERTE